MIDNQNKIKVFVGLFLFIKIFKVRTILFFQRVADSLKTLKFYREDDVEGEGQIILYTEPSKTVASVWSGDILMDYWF